MEELHTLINAHHQFKNLANTITHVQGKSYHVHVYVYVLTNNHAVREGVIIDGEVLLASQLEIRLGNNKN